MKFHALLIATLLCATLPAPAQEKLFSDMNAYNPVPSPDGKYIAYVKTGWDRTRGSGGFGRSNLISEVQFTVIGGAVVGHTGVNSLVGQEFSNRIDGFLGEWLPDSSAITCYRDHSFGLATTNGGKEKGTMQSPASRDFAPAERVAYVAAWKKFVWLERSGQRTLLQTVQGPIGIIDSQIPTSNMIVPSPDGRYLAIAPTATAYGFHLIVYDIHEKKIADLGEATVHPSAEWDYIKPGWNPWFADSSRLTYVSGNVLYTARPDGTHKTKIAETANAALPVASPDGARIAFVSFTSRPMKNRPDLKFWGGSTIWVVSSAGGKPAPVTQASEDTTYDLRWLNRHTLIFDRIEETPFYSHARIWTVDVKAVPVTK